MNSNAFQLVRRLASKKIRAQVILGDHASKYAERRLAKKRTCGERAVGNEIRIIGGRASKKGGWPWIAALLQGDDVPYCGAVLITDQHVLTASHCVAG